MRCPVKTQCSRGWDALHETMRSWSIRSREDLSEGLGLESPFLRPSTGKDLEQSGGERRPVCRVGVSVCADHDASLHGSRGYHPSLVTPSARLVSVPETIPEIVPTVDAVNLQKLFHQQLRVMQACPNHLRGRFREVVRTCLGARHEAVHVHDILMETEHGNSFCCHSYCCANHHFQVVVV